MILTCPRCATRYLIDDRQVWSTGRAVKCEACGQTWRAVGTGVRPPPQPVPATAPPAEPPLTPPADPQPAEVAIDVSTVEIVVEGDDEPVMPRDFQSLESEPGYVPPPLDPEEAHDRAPEPTPQSGAAGTAATGPIVPSPSPPGERLFVTPRVAAPKRQLGGGGRSVGLKLGWALGLLVLIALVAAVADREAIVRAYPGLAGVYRTIGLPVDATPFASVRRTR